MTPRDVSRSNDDRIDSAINDAASRMTHAKPSDALRANVMSRISAEQPARFPWRFVFAGGAIASVALITFASWPSNSQFHNPTISNPTLVNPTVINGIAANNPTAAPNRPSPVMSVVTKNAARVDPAASFAPSEAELEWRSANAPPALERPAPLEKVKSLEMKTIDNITPLTVAPLMVLALGDDGSNR